MPNFSQYLDVDVDEFLDNCSDTELDEVIEWLKDNNHIKSEDVIDIEDASCSKDEIFNDALNNLAGNRFKMSIQEEELIIEL